MLDSQCLRDHKEETRNKEETVAKGIWPAGCVEMHGRAVGEKKTNIQAENCFSPSSFISLSLSLYLWKRIIDFIADLQPLGPPQFEIYVYRTTDYG